MISLSTAIPTSDPILRKAVYIAFRGECFYTGRKVGFDSMHIDHVRPKSKGGADCIDNYVLACKQINLKKSSSIHGSLLAVAESTAKALYSKKVLLVYVSLAQTGQYPRPRGRPPIPDDQRLTERAEIRLSFAERAKYDSLGGAEWVRRQIALAELPPA